MSRPFPLVDSFRSRLFLVLFCGAFSTLFILYFNPMGIMDIQYGNALANFLSIKTVGAWGAATLAITHFVLRKVLGFERFTVGSFLLWFLLDLLAVTLVQFLLFGEVVEIPEFFLIARYTVSLAFLPYLIGCLLLFVFQQTNSSTNASPVSSSDRYAFREAKGKVALAIDLAQVLYIGAENNYIQVVFLENDRVSKKLIRTTIKAIEESMRQHRIVRVHRSYLVNLNAVESIRRERGDLLLQVRHLEDLTLKVSSSFQSTIESELETLMY